MVILMGQGERRWDGPLATNLAYQIRAEELIFASTVFEVDLSVPSQIEDHPIDISRSGVGVFPPPTALLDTIKNTREPVTRRQKFIQRFAVNIFRAYFSQGESNPPQFLPE